jgi:hypothetical protein
MTVLGLAPGSWAEWVGGVGTALAFGATSVAIWQGHRLRILEHDEAMYDQALLVTTTLGMGTEYVKQVHPDGRKESNPIVKVQVVVHNSSRRPIHNVLVTATTEDGDLVGKGEADFVPAGWDRPWLFDPTEKSWGRSGPGSAITGQVTVTYKDIDGTAWIIVKMNSASIARTGPASKSPGRVCNVGNTSTLGGPGGLNTAQ